MIQGKIHTFEWSLSGWRWRLYRTHQRCAQDQRTPQHDAPTYDDMRTFEETCAALGYKVQVQRHMTQTLKTTKYSHSLFYKFYRQFNNISSVIGKGYNELMKLHLVKSYCLPSLFYGCEVWLLTTSDMQKINFVWNNSFRWIFGGFWQESVKLLQFYNVIACYTLHRRKKTFVLEKNVFVYECCP